MAGKTVMSNKDKNQTKKILIPITGLFNNKLNKFQINRRDNAQAYECILFCEIYERNSDF
jgi:hypothetical protein